MADDSIATRLQRILSDDRLTWSFSQLFDDQCTDIPWSKYKPTVSKRTLLRTRGPSDHAERDAICIICYDVLEPNQFTLTHSACSYAAHSECLRPWQDQQRSMGTVEECPMCRQPYSLHEAMDRLHREVRSVQRSMIKEFLGSCIDEVKNCCIGHIPQSAMARELITTAEKNFRLDGKLARAIISALHHQACCVHAQMEDLLEGGAQWIDVSHQMRKKLIEGAEDVLESCRYPGKAVEDCRSQLIRAAEAHSVMMNSPSVHTFQPSGQFLQARFREKVERILGYMHAEYLLEASRQCRNLCEVRETTYTCELLAFHAGTGIWAPDRSPYWSSFIL